MLTTSFFKGANLSGIQLRDKLAELAARRYDISADDARREAEKVVEDMAASRETNDSRVIRGAYISHGYMLLKNRMDAKGLTRKLK